VVLAVVNTSLLLSVDRLEELRRELEQALERAKARANPLIVDLTDEDPWERVKRFARQQRAATRLKRTLTSPDGKYLFIVVRPRGFQAELGKAGEIIRSVEAAIALENGGTVVTRNTRHFARVDGLRVVRWHR